MRSNEAPGQIAPTPPQEGRPLLPNGSALTATLLAIAALNAPNYSTASDRLLTDPTSPGAMPGLPLPTPQRTQAPEVPYLPEDRRLRKTIGLRLSRPPKPPKPNYPPFQDSLKESRTSQEPITITRKQPSPHNMHGSKGSNHHVERSRGHSRRDRSLA
jgi:hypothetical protein